MTKNTSTILGFVFSSMQPSLLLQDYFQQKTLIIILTETMDAVAAMVVVTVDEVADFSDNIGRPK